MFIMGYKFDTRYVPTRTVYKESQVCMEWTCLRRSITSLDGMRMAARVTSCVRSMTVKMFMRQISKHFHFGTSWTVQLAPARQHEIKSPFLTQRPYYEIVNELKPLGASATNQVLEHVGTNHLQAKSICRQFEHCCPILFHHEQPHAAVQAAC